MKYAVIPKPGAAARTTDEAHWIPAGWQASTTLGRLAARGSGSFYKYEHRRAYVFADTEFVYDARVIPDDAQAIIAAYDDRILAIRAERQAFLDANIRTWPIANATNLPHKTHGRQPTKAAAIEAMNRDD